MGQEVGRSSIFQCSQCSRKNLICCGFEPCFGKFSMYLIELLCEKRELNPEIHSRIYWHQNFGPGTGRGNLQCIIERKQARPRVDKWHCGNLLCNSVIRNRWVIYHGSLHIVILDTLALAPIVIPVKLTLVSFVFSMASAMYGTYIPA